MAKEKTIRKHAKDRAEENGWTYWIPSKTKWHSNDIFKVIDMACWKGEEILLVQYTSKGHVSTRKNKIEDFMEENNLEIPEGVEIEVWGYKSYKGFERIEKI